MTDQSCAAKAGSIASTHDPEIGGRSNLASTRFRRDVRDGSVTDPLMRSVGGGRAIAVENPIIWADGTAGCLVR